MCTVSYLPLDEGYIITSNRDEAPDRNITDLVSLSIDRLTVYYPRDPHGGGSWIAFSDSGDTACLLNGAYEPYDRQQVFSLSRGIVLLDSFKYPDAEEFASQYDFSQSAPFTLVLMKKGVLTELIWDGVSVVDRPLDRQSTQFWSSVTLYDETTRAWRRGLFNAWKREHTDYSQDEIIDFHKYGSKDDSHNGFVMNREEIVKTLSISSVACQEGELKFRHLDLQNSSNSIDRVVKHNTHLVQTS